MLHGFLVRPKLARCHLRRSASIISPVGTSRFVFSANRPLLGKICPPVRPMLLPEEDEGSGRSCPVPSLRVLPAPQPGRMAADARQLGLLNLPMHGLLDALLGLNLAFRSDNNIKLLIPRVKCGSRARCFANDCCKPHYVATEHSLDTPRPMRTRSASCSSAASRTMLPTLPKRNQMSKLVPASDCSLAKRSRLVSSRKSRSEGDSWRAKSAQRHAPHGLPGARPFVRWKTERPIAVKVRPSDRHLRRTGTCANGIAFATIIGRCAPRSKRDNPCHAELSRSLSQ